MPGWKLLSDNKQWDLHTEKEGLVCDSNRVLSKGTENEMVFAVDLLTRHALSLSQDHPSYPKAAQDGREAGIMQVGLMT